MKQNSIKILKSRLNVLKKKKNKIINLLAKSFTRNNSNLTLKRHFFFKYIKKKMFLYQNIKKICNFHGKYKSVNKKLKISRTSLNLFLIDNNLFFYKN